MVDADASLQMWFDRGLDFGDGSLVDVQLGNLPRIVTSRSQDKQTTDSRLMSKREAKIVAVEMAICALLAVEPVDEEKQKERESAQLSPCTCVSPTLLPSYTQLNTQHSQFHRL